MAKTVSILLIAASFFAICGCEKSEQLYKEPVIIQLNEKSQQLVSSSGAFGIDLFKTILANETETRNIMVSPLSVSLALAMTYNGSDGETKTAMENALRLNGLSLDEININFKQLTNALLNVDSRVQLSIANSIWYRDDFTVNQDFITLNQNFYDAEVSALDFSSEESVDIINNWVASNTNNKIAEIVDQISPETVMFLINAIYFKGIWKYQFNRDNNAMYSFEYSNGSSSRIEMMSQKADLASYTGENFKMVELLYGQGNWAMDLILPNEGKTIHDVVDEMNPTSWNTWVSALSLPSSRQIILPPFTFEFDLALNDVLSQMGMAIAFNPDAADFSKINAAYQLYISKVKHKTYIEVNEEGTEAAAVTSVEVGVTSVDPSSELIFNRPFLFVIREVSTGTILFIGKVENPQR